MSVVELFDARTGIGIRKLTPVVVAADAESVCDPEGWQVTVECRQLDPTSLVAQATITNVGNRPRRFSMIRWQEVADPGYALAFPREAKPRYFSSENYRREYARNGFTEGVRYLEPLDHAVVESGISEDYAFPGLFVFSEQLGAGLFCAQSTQQRLHAVFRIRGYAFCKGGWLFEIEERPTGLWSVELKPGESYTGESLYFHLAATAAPHEAVGGYYRELKANGTFQRQARNPLFEQRIYCSWNFDFFDQITEQDLLAQIPLLKERFPSVKFVQLDHGYEPRYASGNQAMAEIFYKMEPFDRLKFPSGPKGLADKIRAAGLRPAIWLGLMVSAESLLVKEHPEWLLLDDAGQQVRLLRSCILDPSVAAVRDYIDLAARTLFQEWGYEGLKLDFSGMAFLSKRGRFRQPGKTGVEWQREVASIFRKYLPEDGFLGWCGPAGTGHPFIPLAEYFRCTSDIHSGNWETIKWIGRRLVNTVMLMPESPCLPNLDSLGWSSHFDSEAQWLTWLNLCAVSGMALEVSGDLRKLPRERSVKIRNALELSRPGGALRVLDVPEGEVTAPASVWLNTQPDGRMLLALFNWTSEPQSLPLSYAQLGAADRAWVEVWSGQELSGADLAKGLQLKPFESRLFRSF